MGFYIRKSISVGPLRFNLSKSGIGVSAGVKGFRVGTGPRGNYIHMGRHGVYYRTSLDQLLSHKSNEQHGQSDAKYNPSDVVVDDVVGVPMLPLKPTGPDDLISQLNDAAKASGWLKHPQVPLFYDVNDSPAEWFEVLVQTWGWLTVCQKLWRVVTHTDYTNDYQQKVNAGAGYEEGRKSVEASLTGPPHLASNIQIPGLVCGHSALYFLPDRLLVLEDKQYFALNYKELSVSHSTTTFIEDGALPSDAAVDSYTWQYVNKRGGPDSRFKDNRRIPVMRYGMVEISSPSGLRWVIHTSRVESAKYVVSVLRSVTQDQLPSAEQLDGLQDSSGPTDDLGQQSATTMPSFAELLRQMGGNRQTTELLWVHLHKWRLGDPVDAPFQVGDRVDCKRSKRTTNSIGTVRSVSLSVDVGLGSPLHPAYDVVFDEWINPQTLDEGWFYADSLKWIPGQRLAVPFQVGDRVRCAGDSNAPGETGTIFGVALLDDGCLVFHILLDRPEEPDSVLRDIQWANWPRREYALAALAKLE